MGSYELFAREKVIKNIEVLIRFLVKIKMENFLCATQFKGFMNPMRFN